MTDIPPALPSSAAQVGLQGREVAKERIARDAGQSDAVNRKVKSIDEAGSTVETNDEDVAVFADAEGTGSQGRAVEEKDDAAEAEDGGGSSGGVTEDDDGHLHLDIEA